MSNNQIQEDQFQSLDEEAEPYLEKANGRKNRRDKSAKAHTKREHRKAKLEREYEDGFRGNHN